MMMRPHGESDSRADRVAAWATGTGVGLVVFMVSWLVWNRILDMIFSAPTGPVVAMTMAVLTGATVAIRQGRRLVGRVADGVIDSGDAPKTGLADQTDGGAATGLGSGTPIRMTADAAANVEPTPNATPGPIVV